MQFDAPDALNQLESMNHEQLDALPYGVVRMKPGGEVALYSAFESLSAGLRAARVVGLNFFESVGPCMNNYLVAQRFLDEAALDATLPYVLTFRMRPTPVRLRLLKGPSAAHWYVLIERKP